MWSWISSGVISVAGSSSPVPEGSAPAGLPAPAPRSVAATPGLFFADALWPLFAEPPLSADCGPNQQARHSAATAAPAVRTSQPRTVAPRAPRPVRPECMLGSPAGSSPSPGTSGSYRLTPRLMVSRAGSRTRHRPRPARLRRWCRDPRPAERRGPVLAEQRRRSASCELDQRLLPQAEGHRGEHAAEQQPARDPRDLEDRAVLRRAHVHPLDDAEVVV